MKHHRWHQAWSRSSMQISLNLEWSKFCRLERAWCQVLFHEIAWASAFQASQPTVQLGATMSFDSKQREVIRERERELSLLHMVWNNEPSEMTSCSPLPGGKEYHHTDRVGMRWSGLKSDSWPKHWLMYDSMQKLNYSNPQVKQPYRGGVLGAIFRPQWIKH